MDPNENLREQRELAKSITSCNHRRACDCDSDMERLSELVLALDEWISKGGFLPGRWETAQRKAKLEKFPYAEGGAQ